MNTQKHVIIPGIARKRERALVVARELGLRLTLLDPHADPQLRRYFTRVVEVDLSRRDQVLAAARAVHAEDPVDAIVPALDKGVEPSAWIAAELGLRGNPIEAMQAARNKGMMRELLHARGVPVPRFMKVRSWEEYARAADHVGYPFIFKPVGATLSMGVFRVDGPEALAPTFARMMAVADPTRDPLFSPYRGQFLVEEFLDGHEFSVEGVAGDGRMVVAGVTEKWTVPGDFSERQHAFPARLDARASAEIARAAVDGLSAVGWRCGGFHVEVMQTRRGPRIVEINGRLGGDYISTHLVGLGTGTNLWAAAFQAALGEPFDLSPRWDRGACVSFLIADRPGSLRSFEGLDAAQSTAGVEDVILERRVGDPVRLPPDQYGEHRLAAVIAGGASTDAAIENAQRGLSRLRPVIADR